MQCWPAGTRSLMLQRASSRRGFFLFSPWAIRLLTRAPGSLVALYRAMRLRFGYGFESCDANGPRNVKNIYLAKHRPVFLPPLLLVGSKESVLKVPKRGQFHAAIRLTIWRCDSCVQGAQDSIVAKLLWCGIASEALRRNMPLSLGEGSENRNSQKWLGEAAKGLLDPGHKGLPRVSCTIRNPVSHWCNPRLHRCKRLSAPSVPKTFCTLFQ